MTAPVLRRCLLVGSGDVTWRGMIEQHDQAEYFTKFELLRLRKGATATQEAEQKKSMPRPMLKSAEPFVSVSMGEIASP